MGFSMSAQSAEEVPFVAGFKRTSEGESESTKLRFWIDGRLAALKGVIEGLAMQGRGPDPDYQEDGDIRRLAAIIERLASRPPNMNNGDEESSDLKKWIAGLGVLLSGSFIIGGWVLSTQVASLTAKVDAIAEHQRSQDERITRIENNERR
jgi:hypothetical protein